MDYLEYIETLWAYLPYILYTFVFLTFLPKSLGKIKKFADADYEINRHKYHRCYGPELCCHAALSGEEDAPKVKQRKAVTRVYPKKTNATATQEAAPTATPQIKRQVQASQIQTHTHVNQIAKMFENGGTAKKINRVTPTILPEIRTHALTKEAQHDMELNIKKTSSQLSQLLQENIENSANLLNTSNADCSELSNNWPSEPVPIPRRTRRHIPSPLSYAGTSATPSTASPAASSPLSSPQLTRSPTPTSPTSPTSPVLLRNMPLNMKSSLEDIFAAIARKAERNSEQAENFIYTGRNSLSPVTSIDDILSQRRLSRPLSAYSISDLLMNEENSRIDETYVNNLLQSLNESEV